MLCITKCFVNTTNNAGFSPIHLSRTTPPPLPLPNPVPFAILCSSIALGVMGTLLMRGQMLGLNVLLWTTLLSATAIILSTSSKHQDFSILLFFHSLAVVFAALLAWRASETLNLLALLGLLISLSLASTRNFIRAATANTISQYLKMICKTAVNAAIGILFLIEREIPWRSSSQSRVWRQLRTLLTGFFVALPFLITFAALFSSADAVFEARLKNLFDFDFESLFLNSIWTCFFCWVTAGYLRRSTLVDPVVENDEPPAKQWLSSAELNVALALLNILFLSFVFIQMKYLFGGSAVVSITPSLTFAEYARRGFFELVTASALLLPVLLLADSVHPPDTSKRLLRILSGSLITLLLVVMTSAAKRMQIYQSQFGLTELRFYVSSFIIVLAILFAWFCATVLTGNRRYFAGGMFSIAALSIVALHVVNPDAWIARVNLARAADGKNFDAKYLSGLSTDAAPEISAAQGKLSFKLQQELKTSAPKPGNADWRSWNYSRWAAAQTLQPTRPHTP
jgi:hypothetical protein